MTSRGLPSVSGANFTSRSETIGTLGDQLPKSISMMGRMVGLLDGPTMPT